MDFIFDPSLVLYLPSYELDGASFASRDAYGHLCTVTGAVWRPNGNYFDGSDDKISLDASVSRFSILSEGTIEVWLRPYALDAGYSMVFFGDGDVALDFNALFFRGDQANDPLEWLAKENGVEKVRGRIDSLLSTTEFSHIVLTVDANGNKLFHNANQQTLTYDTGDATKTNFYDGVAAPDVMRVGNAKVSGVDTFPFKGWIGEVWIYNRALTPLEIQHNYLATKWRYR